MSPGRIPDLLGATSPLPFRGGSRRRSANGLNTSARRRMAGRCCRRADHRRCSRRRAKEGFSQDSDRVSLRASRFALLREPGAGAAAEHAPSDGRQSARRVPAGFDQGWSAGNVEGHTVRPHHGPDDVDGEIGAHASGREEIDQSAAWSWTRWRVDARRPDRRSRPDRKFWVGYAREEEDPINDRPPPQGADASTSRS